MDAFYFNPRNGKWHFDGNESTNRTPFAKGITSGSGAPIRKFDPPGETGDGNDWILMLLASHDQLFSGTYISFSDRQEFTMGNITLSPKSFYLTGSPELGEIRGAMMEGLRLY